MRQRDRQRIEKLHTTVFDVKPGEGEEENGVPVVQDIATAEVEKGR
jgi:hypothetical protein